MVKKLRLVAKRGDSVYMILVDETKGREKVRVVDVGAGVAYPPAPLQSVMARGYWREVPQTERGKAQASIEKIMGAG